MRCMCPLYDPNRQLWIELAPLSMPRINHGVLSAGTVPSSASLKHKIKGDVISVLCRMTQNPLKILPLYGDMFSVALAFKTVVRRVSSDQSLLFPSLKYVAVFKVSVAEHFYWMT